MKFVSTLNNGQNNLYLITIHRLKILITYTKIMLLCFLMGTGLDASCQTDSTELNSLDTNEVEGKRSKKSKEKTKLHGLASYYGNKFNGRKTASGEIFDQKKMTAACNKLPLGTIIRVTNPKNGKSVIVKINDRLHPKMKRLVDLTMAAAKKLDYISEGVTKVTVEVIKRPKRR